jgi:hypothetical protein
MLMPIQKSARGHLFHCSLMFHCGLKRPLASGGGSYYLHKVLHSFYLRSKLKLFINIIRKPRPT